MTETDHPDSVPPAAEAEAGTAPPGADAPGEVLVSVADLTKHYGAIRAVDGISFEVRRGDVLGFLGPNGAGKTTAMKMITGFLEPDRGSITVAGIDVAADRLAVSRRIGYLPEDAPAYGEMTVEAFLGFIGEARELEAAEEAIERVLETAHLRSVRGQTIETLSKGYKRRVGLAQALIHDPDVLILDEPTDGLDPNQKAVVQDLISSLSSDRCIVLSTHILDEAERVCNRAVILSEGRILVDSTPSALVTQAPGHNAVRFRVTEGDPADVAETLAAADWCAGARVLPGGEVEAEPRDGENRLNDVLAAVGEHRIADVRVREGRLDELFRDVTRGVAA
ncbi:MAG: ABC transporter ATP-binding protein [Acidobacteriota bacterium]|nr:ABC transporter ATP-binding protein [Acidobacteriota bacterium]MDE2923917.1 ABC transporter ATP-binding protein [Acidobacteriota bacterium]MDE3264879.1 ABC transporter ATP-binding protein [Acidobacteriota bacterium]